MSKTWKEGKGRTFHKYEEWRKWKCDWLVWWKCYWLRQWWWKGWKKGKWDDSGDNMTQMTRHNTGRHMTKQRERETIDVK